MAEVLEFLGVSVAESPLVDQASKTVITIGSIGDTKLYFC